MAPTTTESTPYAPHEHTTVDNPMVPAPYRVERVRQETDDTFSFDLQPAAGGLCSRFEPGQFNMVYVFGRGDLPISISGDPQWRHSLTHTVRAVGLASQTICRVKEGDMLGIRGPFGSSWPEDEAAGKDLVIIGGGIGLAPLRPTIYNVLAKRVKFKQVSLLYGARTPRQLLFRDELARWRDRHDLYLGVTVDSAESTWSGNVGVVTTLISKAQFDPNNVVAMVCGPEIMMRFVIKELQKRGVPPESIYISMERNMKCAVGFCGHCQFGSSFMCKHGPIFRYDRVAPIFTQWEV